VQTVLIGREGAVAVSSTEVVCRPMCVWRFGPEARSPAFRSMPSRRRRRVQHRSGRCSTAMRTASSRSFCREWRAMPSIRSSGALPNRRQDGGFRRSGGPAHACATRLVPGCRPELRHSGPARFQAARHRRHRPRRNRREGRGSPEAKGMLLRHMGQEALPRCAPPQCLTCDPERQDRQAADPFHPAHALTPASG